MSRAYIDSRDLDTMDHEEHGHKARGSRLALKGIVEESAEGSLVVINDYISFLGDIDPKSSVLRKRVSRMWILGTESRI